MYKRISVLYHDNRDLEILLSFKCASRSHFRSEFLRQECQRCQQAAVNPNPDIGENIDASGMADNGFNLWG